MDRREKSGADVKTGTSQPLKKTFRSDGLEAVRRGEDSRAIELFTTIFEARWNHSR
ncbi:hypothetical protein OS493_023080 [Desmophyllum pertusum]|uniref:Uncharacterized protein n=1 Tax=Desmophyllum pertusum TaxID=174260 RepID=A0A9X0CRP3_9CNID|nr:hypothetical protein OS493_023080 [Desmophyllum pertusum]